MEDIENYKRNYIQQFLVFQLNLNWHDEYITKNKNKIKLVKYGTTI